MFSVNPSPKLVMCQFLIITLLLTLSLGHSISESKLNRGQDEEVEVFSMETDTDGMHNYRRAVNSESEKQRLAGILEVEGASFWVTEAQTTLANRLKNVKIEKEAKNTVFFLGDGMSLPTVTASRIYKGQTAGSTLGGEEATLFFEGFPNIGISKTFCSDSQVADSACSATAYLSGIKANIKTIGVTSTVPYRDCIAQMNATNQVASVLAWAQAAGKSTGVVTTTRVTHASPAGTYAHIASRDWENDQVIERDGSDSNTCDDIAEQLILKSPGQNINVILAGGRREFLPKFIADPDEPDKMGLRGDGINLIDKWVELKSKDKARYVWNRTAFEAIKPNETDFLLGLFNWDHLDYVLDKQEDPSLPELVEKAIQILSRNPKGFFLFVEGGKIDHAHHDSLAQKAFSETLKMDEAVEKAANMTNIQDTLILVTSDHAHTMSISGYPVRGNPLLGLSGAIADDKLPYPTISYANGPGYRRANNNTGERYDVTNDDFENKDYRQISTAPIGSETHGGDDVMIFSRGPFSHLLTGVVHQSYIPHVVGYASCTGAGSQFCADPAFTTTTPSSAHTMMGSFLLPIFAVLAHFSHLNM